MGVGKVVYTLTALFLGYVLFIAMSPLYLLTPFLSTGGSFLVLWHLYEKVSILDRFSWFKRWKRVEITL